ncbi:MAG: rhomboid family intramembrane serine protease [Saprospiraceae bacterium]|nr:rhomboid family intramembrane serine protease [Saprospiraceae bacterium]MDW8230608.1 rhomboid family intramembrane serine protease [Saprospiraceae bacterium]
MPITYLIIGFTVAISLWAFNDSSIFTRLKHWPYAEAQRGEYYRLLTGGFLHADYVHLLFNMITLYFFGDLVENWFGVIFPGIGPLLYLVFYLLAIVAASLATHFRYQRAPYFASIGASGATSAVLFAAILLAPTLHLYLMFIPIPIPGVVFGILYLWYSSYAARRGGDGIDHLAHFYGAVFGFVFPIFFKPELLPRFFQQVVAWVSGWLG